MTPILAQKIFPEPLLPLPGNIDLMPFLIMFSLLTTGSVTRRTALTGILSWQGDPELHSSWVVKGYALGGEYPIEPDRLSASMPSSYDIRTVVLTSVTAPVLAIAITADAAVTLSGASVMTMTSESPKEK